MAAKSALPESESATPGLDASLSTTVLWVAGGLGIIATVIAAVLPALVGIWQARLGFRADQAGFVAAAELFAQVVGTGAFIWAAQAWSWRACAAVGLGIMIIGNLASAAHLVLAGTASSAELINNDFRAIRRALPAKTRARIAALERRGIYTRAGAYRTSYARLCRKALAKYNYVQPQSEMPDETGTVSWEVLREMWVRKSDFRIDGNLRDFDLTDSLGTLRLPALIMIGDRDLVSRRSAGILHAAIPGSQLVIMRDAGHMMFVDQPRAISAHSRRIFAAPQLTRGDRARCLAAGMDDHIGKPVLIDDIRIALRRWVGTGNDSGSDAAPELRPDTNTR